MIGFEGYRTIQRFSVLGLGLIVLTIGLVISDAQAKSTPKFKSKIAKTFEKSQEWWAEPARPPKGAPNVKTI